MGMIIMLMFELPKNQSFFYIWIGTVAAYFPRVEGALKDFSVSWEIQVTANRFVAPSLPFIICIRLDT
jgi:hypothetical protein